MTTPKPTSNSAADKRDDGELFADLTDDEAVEFADLLFAGGREDDEPPAPIADKKQRRKPKPH